MKKVTFIMICFGFLIPRYVTLASAENFIGLVKSIKGNATIERNM